MSLRISYFSGTDSNTRLCYGVNTGSATVTLGASSADAGAIPDGSSSARLTAGEDCIVSNNGVAASDTNGWFLAAGSIIDIVCPASGQFKAKTA